jgi:hypothetical protein
MSQIQITGSESLGSLEELLRDLNRRQAEDPRIVALARDVGSTLFVDARICSLLAAAARRGPLIVVDARGAEGAAQRFNQSLEGIAARVFASRIQDAKGNLLAAALGSLPIAERKNSEMIEPVASQGTSLTYCVLDLEDPDGRGDQVGQMPLAFAACFIGDDFHRQLTKRRQERLEKGASQDYSFNVDAKSDRAISDFVYELIQNSGQHGSLDEHGRPIYGLRYFRLKKHIANDRAEFVSRSKDFSELAGYLRTRANEHRTSKFYEITVSDHGIGIINRYVATRPETLQPSGADARYQLLLQIIRDHLTSRIGVSGAGQGLSNVINAVRTLGAFLSIRTDCLWVYMDGTQADREPALKQVIGGAPHANFLGTQFNLLVPMS